jgi:arsenate reductase
MAEAIVNTQRGDVWEAVSAGTNPTGEVHPKAVQVLAEIDIHPQNATPKHVNHFANTPFDLVVTVCDDAAENCPIWLGQGKRTHISFPDPAKASGSDEEIMQVFRQVRDDIQRRVLALLDTI